MRIKNPIQNSNHKRFHSISNTLIIISSNVIVNSLKKISINKNNAKKTITI